MELARTMLETYDRLVVVGASPEPWKPAHFVPAEMIDAGFDVVPVNPNAATVLERTCYPTLAEVEDVQLVNVFRRPEFVAKVVAEAIAVGARAIWVQSGIRSPEARRLAEEAGIPYIEDRCIAVDRARFGITKPSPRTA